MAALDSPTEVEATMLLCDSAQSVGGKLYILGGGFSQLSTAKAGGRFNMGLAVKVSVPWSRSNEQIPILIRLVTDQGEIWEDPNGNKIEAQTMIEVGRPPGLKHGTPLDACLALNFVGLPLEQGGYSWNLMVGDTLRARIPFNVNP